VRSNIENNGIQKGLRIGYSEVIFILCCAELEIIYKERRKYDQMKVLMNAVYKAGYIFYYSVFILQTNSKNNLI